MVSAELRRRVGGLSAAHLADACIRAKVPVRCAPAAVTAVVPGSRMAGRALPARHAGSVDIFLEAIEQAKPGDVLVVDNGGRLDESCVGDLIVLEAASARLAGVVIWGLHRDTADIRALGLPVFSLGAIPTGPLLLSERAPDALTTAFVGQWPVTRDDLVVGDQDGVLLLPLDRTAELVELAEGIRDVERGQAEQMRLGLSLRQQVDFTGYLAGRTADPMLTFRQHLRSVQGAIEE